MPKTTFIDRGMSWYLGNQGGNLSQFDPSGQVSPGQMYVPDEVAKMIVKEAGLGKADTISKKAIIYYLETMGLDRQLAPDVAQVLRDSYGVTPTFDEDAGMRSGNLLEELDVVVNESYPAPFVMKGPEILTEEELYGQAIQEQIDHADDPTYASMMEEVLHLSPREIDDIAAFCEWVGDEGLDYLESLIDSEPEGFAEAVAEGMARPHLVPFLPEDVQYCVGDMYDCVDEQFSFSREVRRRGLGPQGKKASTATRFPSATKVIKKHEQDVARRRKKREGVPRRSDPLAARKPGHMAAMSRKERQKHTDTLIQRRRERERHGGPKLPKDMTPSRMAKAGQAAVGLARKAKQGADTAFSKVGEKARGAAKAAGAAATSDRAKKAGQAIGKAAGATARGVGKVAGAAARGVADVAGGAAGRFAGSFAKHYARGKGIAHKQMGLSGQPSQAKSPSGEKKPGLLRKLGRGLAAVGRAVYGRAKAANPGMASVASGAKKSSERRKKEGGAVSGLADGLVRNGRLISEMAAVFGDEAEGEGVEEEMQLPAEVIEGMEPGDVADGAVLECLSQMSWDDLAQMANIMVLPAEESFALVRALGEGMAAFRDEWRSVQERVDIPTGMDRSTFVALSKITVDEGVVPKVVLWAGRALQAGGPVVEGYVRESYPELGRTVYGPAGDPSEGPNLAKSYMTPYEAGTYAPNAAAKVQDVRYFVDPAERKAKREARLKEVEGMLRDMEHAAEKVGVPPEGLFLNKWRDLHRERVRYS